MTIYAIPIGNDLTESYIVLKEHHISIITFLVFSNLGYPVDELIKTNPQFKLVYSL